MTEGDLTKGFILRLRKCIRAVGAALVLIGLLFSVLNCRISAGLTTSPAIMVNNGALSTNSTIVTLTLNASAIQPNIPSPAWMCIQNSNQTAVIWEPYSTSKIWNLTSGDGFKMVYFRIRSGSNNTVSQPQFAVILLDTTPPSLNITSPPNDTILDSSSLQVNWSTRDMASGLNCSEVSLDNGEWIIVGNRTTYDFTGLAYGNHTIAIRAVDNAGNFETASTSVTVNVISPTPTPSGTGPVGGIVTWLIAAIAGVAVATAAIAIVYVMRKRSKAAKLG